MHFLHSNEVAQYKHSARSLHIVFFFFARLEKRLKQRIYSVYNSKTQLWLINIAHPHKTEVIALFKSREQTQSCEKGDAFFARCRLVLCQKRIIAKWFDNNPKMAQMHTILKFDRNTSFQPFCIFSVFFMVYCNP